MGPGDGRVAHRHRGGDGLDRLRRRRAPGAQAGHGRATPLVWLSVHKDELTDARNAYEDAAVRRLVEVLPAGVKCGLMYQPPPEQDGIRSIVPYRRGFRISG